VARVTTAFAVPAAGRVQELGDVLDRLLEQQLA
jgi:hypothetical protein